MFADYLRSHFSVSLPKALRSAARDYLSMLRRATCYDETHEYSCSPISPAELLAAASNLSSSNAIGPDKVADPMLKDLPRSGMDFFFTFSVLPNLYIRFLPSGRHLLLFPSIGGKVSRLSCFLPAYLFHLLRIKAF